MLNVYKIAEWARKRARNRMSGVKAPDKNNPRMYAALNQPFHERLFDACKRVPDDPKGMPEVGFLALPERLLSKLSYLCLDKQKRSLENIRAERPDEITDEMVNCLIAYEADEEDALFINIRTSSTFDRLKYTLLGHGLSPIGDSILLLADLGRASRAASVLSLEPIVMLADISWMSSNRSIRQFATLKDSEIDTGLRVCLDKRTRLYEAMSIRHDIHEILPYEKAKKISGKKLKQISNRYMELAQTIWGENAVGRLDHDHVKLISEQLYKYANREIEDSPPYMRTLGQFPGALAALEDVLKPHLEILRVIAKQFSAFDEEVFTYFFAQYYAQDEYRGSVLKIAPISEKNFDEPFDKLDKYFRAWGEGHSLTDILATDPAMSNSPLLSAAYLPQYALGKMRALPYAPLSLDAMKQPVKDHEIVRKQLIMLDGDAGFNLYAVHKANLSVLTQTSLEKRNRLLADVTSFIVLCLRQGYDKEVKEACDKIGVGTFDTLLMALADTLPAILAREREAKEGADLRSLWLTWFKSTDIDATPDYVPFHMCFSLMDESDWTPKCFDAAASICLLAHLLYLIFT